MIRKDDGREFYLNKCKECGLVYLNPRPEWQELKYFYACDYYTNVPASGIRRNFFYRQLRKIKRAVLGAPNPKFWNFGKNRGRFLDVGCGSGTYESYLIEKYPGWEFYGVEPGIDSYRLAKNISGFRVFNGDLKNADYGDNFFDVILLSHSLEHMHEPMEAIAECFRILKPGGRLVIAVPNFGSLARRLFGGYWIHLDAPRHLFHFCADALRHMVQKNGFKIESEKFEVLSGSITKSAAYTLNLNRLFFDTPFVSLLIHYLIWPVDRLIELTPFASGVRIIAVKP